MLKKIRLLLFLLAGILLLNPAQPLVQALGPSLSTIYFPLVGKTPAPKRLGPNVSPGAIAFVVDPTNPGIVYDGTYGGGIFKSYDGGQNWAPASQGLPDGAQIQSMAIDPANPQRIYAGLYYNGAPNFASGVYRTDDGGKTWSATARMDNPIAGADSNHVVVYALAVSADGGVVYAGTRTKVSYPPFPSDTFGYGGVFKSIDHGVSWTVVNNGLPWYDLYIYGVAVDPTNADRVYAALHGSGIYRSLDGGASWAWSNDGVSNYTETQTAVRSVAVDPAAPNRIIFGTVERDAYISDNGADSWTSTAFQNVLMFGVARSQAHHLYASQTDGTIRFSAEFGKNNSWVEQSSKLTNAFFAVDPTNENVLYAGGSTGPAGTKKSTDGGVTFSPITSGISGFPVTGAVIDPANPNRMFVSLFGWGVMTTTDGGANWNAVTANLPTPNIQGLAMYPSNSEAIVAITLANGVWLTANSGVSWFPLADGYPAVGISLNANSLPYRVPAPLEPREGPLVEVSAPTINAAAPVPGLSAAVSPFSSPQILIGTAGQGVVRWTGSVWTATNVAVGNVNALLYDRQTSGRVWLGGDVNAGILQVSADFGQNWTPAANGLGGRTVISLAQSTLNPDLLAAGTDAGVYVSSDRGASWVPAGLNTEMVKAVVFPAARADRLLASTATAIYRSNDLGANWVNEDSQLEG
jgi:photosystem II stability/assembly factor-like uncharacterized protein